MPGLEIAELVRQWRRRQEDREAVAAVAVVRIRFDAPDPRPALPIEADLAPAEKILWPQRTRPERRNGVPRGSHGPIRGAPPAARVQTRIKSIPTVRGRRRWRLVEGRNGEIGRLRRPGQRERADCQTCPQMPSHSASCLPYGFGAASP